MPVCAYAFLLLFKKFISINLKGDLWLHCFLPLTLSETSLWPQISKIHGPPPPFPVWGTLVYILYPRLWLDMGSLREQQQRWLITSAQHIPDTKTIHYINSLQIKRSRHFFSRNLKPCSDCLHSVIWQINGKAWNVAFTLTKVTRCREEGAGRLWHMDYVLRNLLNVWIIWWRCQFAVSSLSLPHFLFLPLWTKADFAATLLKRIWSLERWRYTRRRDTDRVWDPAFLQALDHSANVRLCYSWICIIISLSQKPYRCKKKIKTLFKVYLLGHLKARSHLNVLIYQFVKCRRMI